MTGLQVQVTVSYLVNVPQKDIDQLREFRQSNKTDEEIAEDIANCSISHGREDPLDFEVEQITELVVENKT